jgi:peptidoglycan/LPS O-acetylase OafA/YrhL
MTRDDAPEPLTAGHIPVLDGLRGVAILLVLVFHLWPASGGHSTLRLDEALSNVIASGWMGVDLFFVLSGFLITGILLDAKAGRGYFRNFYARRFLRIFPLYYGFVFALVVLIPLLPAFREDAGLEAVRRNQGWLWSYLYNVKAALNPGTHLGEGWAGHLWSLAVEEQFYIVWPAVVFLCRPRSLAWACVFCIIGAPLLRAAILHGFVGDMNTSLASDILMPSRVDTLAIGALIAVAVRQPSWLPTLRRAGPPCAIGGGLVFAGIALYDRSPSPFPDRMQIFGLSAIAIAYGGVLITVLMVPAAGRAGRFFAHPGLSFFGRYAYGLYVLHFPIMIQASSRLNREGGIGAFAGSDIPAHLGFLFVVGSMSVTAAWLSWNLYEKQFLKLKRFFPYGGTASPGPQPDGEGQAALTSR